MSNIKMALFILLGVALLSSAIFSQESQEQIEDIGEISFDDILNAETTVGSKKKKKISHAPAIISVFNAEEIRNMGAVSLYEILNLIPGVNITETYFGYTSIEFRGNLQTHYNNKSLLLINNHPMHNIINGSYYLEQIPVESIEKIEIIRGPGSILYGTNAFAGVIKVVTKNGKSKGDDGLHLKMTGGSFGTLSPSISFGKKEKDLELFFNVSMTDSDGYPFIVDGDEENRTGEIPYKNDTIHSLVSFKYKSIRMNAGYFENKKSKFGLIPTLASTGLRNLKGWFFDITFTRKLSDRMSLSISGYFDHISKEEDIEWYPPLASFQSSGTGEKVFQEYSGYKYGIDVQSSYKLSKNTSITGGILYENQTADPYTFQSDVTGEVSEWAGVVWDDQQNAYDLSAYCQFDAQIDRFGIIGGIRINDNKGYGVNITPRFAVVYSISTPLSLKFLYGKAFRSPSIFETSVNTPNVLYGDPELKPEGIDTVDIGLDYMIGSRHNIRLNFFYISTNKLIARSGMVPAGERGATNNTPKYANSDGGQKFNGLEGEIKGTFTNKSVYFFNFSYIFNGIEDADDSDIQFLQKITANLGFNLKLGQRFTISPYIQYRGKREGVTTKGMPSETDPYLLMNLIIKIEPLRNLELILSAKNLFNENYRYPEYIRRNIVSFQGGPERSIFGTLIYRF